MKKAAVKLTALEQQVLALMVANAEQMASGDFGMMETLDYSSLHITGQQLGGVVTQLQRKGCVTLHEPVETNGGPARGGERYTQFTISGGR